MAETPVDFTHAWMRRMEEHVLRLEAKLDGFAMRTDERLQTVHEEVTVLTGAFMRLEGSIEGDRLSYTGMLSLHRQREARLARIEERLAKLEGADAE